MIQVCGLLASGCESFHECHVGVVGFDLDVT